MEFIIKQNFKFLKTIVYVNEAKSYRLEKMIGKSLGKIAVKYPNTTWEVLE